MTTTQSISYRQTHDSLGTTRVFRLSDIDENIKDSNSLRLKTSTVTRDNSRANSHRQEQRRTPKDDRIVKINPKRSGAHLPVSRATSSQVSESAWQQEFAAAESNRLVRGNAVFEMEEGPAGRRFRVEKEVVFAGDEDTASTAALEVTAHQVVAEVTGRESHTGDTEHFEAEAIEAVSGAIAPSSSETNLEPTLSSKASAMDEIRSRRTPSDHAMFPSYLNDRVRSAYNPPPPPFVDRNFESVA